MANRKRLTTKKMPITITLDPSVIELVNLIADKTEQSFSSIVNEILKKELTI